jgi:hypothetical protein
MPSGEGKAIILLSVFALALVAAGAARADDAIKAGKWEYTAQVQMPNMPNMPKLPPGVQLPPNLQMGPNGMKVTNTRCISPDEAAPDGRPPGQNNSKCTRDKWERDGGTVRWAMTCPSSHGPVHAEGIGHYHGDTMEADITTQAPPPNGGPSQTMTTHVTGHYLGACDAK